MNCPECFGIGTTLNGERCPECHGTGELGAGVVFQNRRLFGRWLITIALAFIALVVIASLFK